jgi:hypothetical protein
MATITKRTWRRSNGTKGCAWIVSYFDQHKRRLIRTFPTKAEAEIWRREELRRVPITVAEADAAWLAQCEGDGLQAATIRQYRQPTQKSCRRNPGRSCPEMNRVLDQQPQLGAFGFGVYDQRQKTAAEGAWHPG